MLINFFAQGYFLLGTPMTVFCEDCEFRCRIVLLKLGLINDMFEFGFQGVLQPALAGFYGRGSGGGLITVV